MSVGEPGQEETIPCEVMVAPATVFAPGVELRIVIDAIRRRADYAARKPGAPPERLTHKITESAETAHYANSMAGLAIRDRNQALTYADKRVTELLEANNRYQQEARDARAEVARLRGDVSDESLKRLVDDACAWPATQGEGWDAFSAGEVARRLLDPLSSMAIGLLHRAEKAEAEMAEVLAALRRLGTAAERRDTRGDIASTIEAMDDLAAAAEQAREAIAKAEGRS